MTAPKVNSPPTERSAVNKHNRQNLEKLSREGSAGGTPAVLGVQATLLERLVSLKLAERLPPVAPGASYRYRISDKGTRLLNSSE